MKNLARTRNSRSDRVGVQHRNQLAALVLVAITVGGCSPPRGPDYSKLNLAQVDGVVKLNDAPLPGARVEFAEADKRPARSCFGETDQSGHYIIYRDKNVPGCLPGEMIIRITTGQRTEGEDAPVTDTSIAGRYNRKSELRETVAPDGSHTFNFDLTSP